MQKLLSSLLFPQENACHFCERFLTERGVLCAECMKALSRSVLAQPVWERSLPPLSICLSACRYENMARHLVHGLKYNADSSLAQPLGEAMLRVLMNQPALYRRIDWVLPVPLHAARLEQRGYNQAELLTRVMAQPARLPVRTGLLERIRPTDTQVGRSRAERMQAMRGAFHADSAAVRGKVILLVDDVLTTGATAVACAEALRRAGAAETALITACRA